MTGIKIDGKEIAQSVKDRVAKAVEELKSQGINPCLATVLVGDNPASATYVKNKHKACEEVGIITKDFKLASEISQLELNKINYEEMNYYDNAGDLLTNYYSINDNDQPTKDSYNILDLLSNKQQNITIDDNKMTSKAILLEKYLLIIARNLS